MVVTRRQNYGSIVQTPPRRAPRPVRPEPVLKQGEAIEYAWDNNLDGFRQIRRQEYPEVRKEIWEKYNFLLPAWDPVKQLAPATIEQHIVNGLAVECENEKSARIDRSAGTRRIRGAEEQEEARSRCQNTNQDTTTKPGLDFMPCQGHKYGLVEDGQECGWVCTECAQDEHEQWDFTLEHSRILVHCWDCSQDDKSATKKGDRGYAHQHTKRLAFNNRDWTKGQIEAAKKVGMLRSNPLIIEELRQHCGCRKRFAPVKHTRKRTGSYHLCSQCRQTLYERCMAKILDNCEDAGLGLTKRVAADTESGELEDWVDDSDIKNRNYCRCDPPEGPRKWDDIKASYSKVRVTTQHTEGYRMCLHCKLPTRATEVPHPLTDACNAYW